jgi:hypothetical protein
MIHMKYLLQFTGINLSLPARGCRYLYAPSCLRAAEKEGVPGKWASGIADSRKPHR